MMEKFNDVFMRKCQFLLLLPLLSACSNDYDAEQAGKYYCRCMKENGSPDQYPFAIKICDGELIKKNRFYKLFYVDMANQELDEKVTMATRDSVQKFIHNMDKYLNEHCCEETLRCPIDSIVQM